MKVFVSNYNGILDDLIIVLKNKGEFTENYHEADCFVLWQDVRGDFWEIGNIIKNSLKKPLIVVQHGRGATRDYGPPNNFSLQADKICVWGEKERDRLLSYGIEDKRIEVTGCPLFSKLKSKNRERLGINLLLVPVIAQKEEPENILVYAAVKKWECDKLIKSITMNFDKMKKAWAYEDSNYINYKLDDGKIEKRLWEKKIIEKLPRYITYGLGMLHVKATGIHDMHQYMSPVILTDPKDENHIDETIELLRNTDVMICLEEGTMQLLACALDIPIICVDIFNYVNYGGNSNYDKIEKINTLSCYHTRRLDKIGDLLDHALEYPNELERHRIKVCEEEGGAHLGNATENIIKVIEQYRPIRERIELIKA